MTVRAACSRVDVCLGMEELTIAALITKCERVRGSKSRDETPDWRYTGGFVSAVTWAWVSDLKVFVWLRLARLACPGGALYGERTEEDLGSRALELRIVYH